MTIKPIRSIDLADLDNVTGGACPGGNCGASGGAEEAQQGAAGAGAGGGRRLGGGLLRGLLGRLRGGQ